MFARVRQEGEEWLATVALLGIWEVLSRLALQRQWGLPPPSEVFETLVELTTQGLWVAQAGYLTLQNAALISLTTLAIGFGLTLATAIPLGVLIGRNKGLEEYVDTAVNMLRPIPPAALIPLLVVLIGLSDTSSYFLIWFGSFFPMLLNTISAVKHVDPIYTAAARVLGTKAHRMLTAVVFPASLPGILTGIQVSWQVAWAMLVLSELVVTRGGIGNLVTRGEFADRYDVVIACMGAIAVLGLVFDAALRRIRGHLLRWQSDLVV